MITTWLLISCLPREWSILLWLLASRITRKLTVSPAPYTDCRSTPEAIPNRLIVNLAHDHSVHRHGEVIKQAADLKRAIIDVADLPDPTLGDIIMYSANINNDSLISAIRSDYGVLFVTCDFPRQVRGCEEWKLGITGGEKNLGALIAKLFATEGAHLALHYNSAASKAESEKLAAELIQKHAGQTIRLYQADPTKAAAVAKVYRSVLADFDGKLDIVVNAVGMVLKKPLTEITEAEYNTMFAVNWKAAFFVTQEAAKAVSDGGKIIDIVTSLLAAYTPFYTSYQGSNAPVEWFTKGLSKELIPRGISVNAIAPAFHKSSALGGRLTKIEDIAPIVKFLATEGAWINGQTIFANGGYTSR